MNRFINVCGFGNTGCTAQADFLADFEGVFGILKDHERNTGVTNAPYQEFGILKCLYSFGGVLISKLHKLDISIGKDQLNASLIGNFPPNASLNEGAKVHLKKRKALYEEYGDAYQTVVENSLKTCPENFDSLSVTECIDILVEALHIWCEGIYSLGQSYYGTISKERLVLGFKNDPTGAYPLLSSIIKDGVTSAILRNPFDTAWDFNRHYKIESNNETIEWYCNHYNSQLNSARSQILNYREQIGERYFVHDFESFVTSEQHRNDYLERMVGARSKVNSYYVAEKSATNVNVHGSLSVELIKIIEDRCLKNYRDFKNLLKSEGLFFQGSFEI